jgi:hypothetical protein
VLLVSTVGALAWANSPADGSQPEEPDVEIVASDNVRVPAAE